MSWKNWKFRQIYSLGLKYQYFYSMSRGHPESYIIEKLCLMNSLARLLLFLVYDNHFWPKNTVIISFFLKFKKMTMNLHQYCNKQNPPSIIDELKTVPGSCLFWFRPLTEPQQGQAGRASLEPYCLNSRPLRACGVPSTLTLVVSIKLNQVLTQTYDRLR